MGIMDKYAFLEKSLELFAEPWMAEHKAVMATWDKVDAMEQRSVMMVAMFQCLQDMSQAHRDPSRRLTSSDAKMLSKLWSDWYDSSRSVLKEVAELEAEGFN